MSVIESFGNCVWVGYEELVDVSVVINGSAFVFLSLVVNSLKDVGIREGLNVRGFLELVKMSFKGFVKLLEKECFEMIIE